MIVLFTPGQKRLVSNAVARSNQLLIVAVSLLLGPLSLCIVPYGGQILDCHIGETHFTHCDVWISGFSDVAPDQSPRPPRFFLRHEWRL